MTTIAPKTAGMAIAPAGGQLKTEKGRAQKIQRVMRIVTMMMFIVAVMMVTVFATGAATNISDGVQTGMDNIFQVLKYISYGVGVVSLAVAGFKLVLGGQKGMETAKADIIKIVLFALIVLLAPTIVSSIFKWFGQGNAKLENPVPQPSIK